MYTKYSLLLVALVLLTGCGQAVSGAATDAEATANAVASLPRVTVAPAIDEATPTPTLTAEPTQAPAPTVATDPTPTTGSEPVEPSIEPNTPTPTAAPLAVPLPDDVSARLQTPPGFAVRRFAGGLNDPRLMAVGPDGQLYVAERDANAVIRLPDRNRDGLADVIEVVAGGLNQPHNVEWFEGSLYVAEFSQITRMTDLNNDGDFNDEGERALVTDNIPAGGSHTSRTLRFGPDGMLYVAAGSSGNTQPETDLRRATIMRFTATGEIPADNPFANDPDLTRRPVWAEGLRNSVDFLFLPDGRLWANHNGSDGLGDDLPPEEIVIEVEAGRHYGWPYCYTPAIGVVAPGTSEVRDERVAMTGPLTSCAEAVPALFTDLAHQAPLGMTRYDGAHFPAVYQGDLFVAYHGSWNSTVPRDCRVQRIIVENGQPVGSEPFLTGFRDSAGQACGGAWGRPADVVVGADGELFISDDHNGNIYRMVYTGTE